VAEITRELPPGAERVGVFGTQDASQIVAVVEQAGLTVVQLHGGFDEGLAAELLVRLAGRASLIQTMHWSVGQEGEAERVAAQLHHAAELGIERVLVDSRVGGRPPGGTGVSFDWEAARQVFADAPAGLRLVLAGGLRPENVADAVDRLRPWGVDVASGVEVTVGHKDPVRVAAFIARSRGA
jgi:phosphoribosylanthranilate isomerase